MGLTGKGYLRLPLTSHNLDHGYSHHSAARPFTTGFLVGILVALGGWWFTITSPFGNPSELTSMPKHVIQAAVSPSLPRQFAPSFPKKVTTFSNIPELLAAPSPSSNAHWDSLVPKGVGFVNVTNPADFSLKGGIEGVYGERWSVAVFHELHCLRALRSSYFSALDLLRPGSSQAARSAEHRNQLADKHVQHCFSYIAQALRCNADTTVEWAMANKDGSRTTVSGWGIPHVCTDWDALTKWAAVNSAVFAEGEGDDPAHDHHHKQ